MAEIVAETARLVLRREIDGDREVWLQHMNTQRVMEHLGGPQSPEQVAQAFERMAGSGISGGYPFALVALKSDGTLIGKCGLATIDTEAAPQSLRGQVQVGWTLREDHWGQGYASEAAEAALELAFERFALPVVYGQTSERNAPSCRMMARLGMERVPELDYHDPDYAERDNPTIVFALDAAQWRSSRPGGRACG